MPVAADFSLQRVQVSVFTPEAGQFKASAFLRIILSEFANRYDGEPTVIAGPKDVPQVLISSGNKEWNLVAFTSRIDSVWNSVGDGPSRLADMAMECARPVLAYRDRSGVYVGRVGVIITRTCENPNPAQTLIDRFCQDDVKADNSPASPLRHSRSFEIHNHKRYQCGDMDINSWVRCKSGARVADNAPVIIVEQDINSLNEELNTRRFDGQQLEGFVSMACQEADGILKLYFPQ